jgi:superfamily II DNA or RNA helicase
MAVFPDTICFRGKWRPYQQRVLDNLSACLDDRKIHLVAAPGSGKTTVGLAILLRLGRPALILAPSVTIREQWIDRFVSSFLPPELKPGDWISNSIRSPRAVTVITYQSLHSAYVRASGPENGAGDEGDDAPEAESEDFSGFDLPAALKNAGIETVCMDEAHHLRIEWWKALEATVASLGKKTVTVSLTATPPYDSTPAQWQRYIALCGEIDEEIFAPELVRDGNLCPHQDYVYFSWPDSEEAGAMSSFRSSAYTLSFGIAREPEFIKAVSAHPGLKDPDKYAEFFLDRPDYLTSMLVFFADSGIPAPRRLRRMLGAAGPLPKLDLRRLEVLLQGFLYDDRDSYPGCDDYRANVIKRLAAAGHIERGAVALMSSDRLNRMLVTSRGKLDSIRAVTRAEASSLGGGLRLLILTDYIRRDFLPRVGDPSASADCIGVLPIFEILRRENIPGLRLGVLSGSVVIIPEESGGALTQIAAQLGVSFTLRPMQCPGYLEVTAAGAGQKQTVAALTALFTRGGINALVGTKSLLGEGWDSPCINTLILASFVGSFMLSNQMRGRAIRVDPACPGKAANIWHLVSMEPPWVFTDSDVKKLGLMLSADSSQPLSDDFVTLRRRFRAFLGVGYSDDIIEDGLDRLSFIRPPYDRGHIAEIDRKMLELSADRAALSEKWRRAVERCPDVSQVVELQPVDKAVMPRRYLFVNGFALLASALVGEILVLLLLSPANGFPAFIPVILSLLLLAFPLRRALMRLACAISPQRYLLGLGRAILKALKETGDIETAGTKVKTERMGEAAVSCYIDGGTTYEKNLFSDCVSQLFGVIDNPRYLLVQRRSLFFLTRTEYYAVPELFGAKKETAQLFLRAVQRTAGDFSLVYTRSEEGRRVLLKARTRSFAALSGRILDRSRRVKSKWE